MRMARARLAAIAAAAAALAQTACSGDAADATGDPRDAGVDATGDAPQDAPVARWQLALHDLPEALIGVSGTSARDVWLVGSDAGDGPLVLHYDGTTLRRVRTGDRGALWWAHARSATDVFLGGAGGRILRGSGQAFAPEATPGTDTVFGIWSPDASTVWAVGGRGADGGFAWRRDASGWQPVTLPGGLAGTVSLYKVWGRSASEAWLVGTRGTLLGWNGSALTPLVSGTQDSLFTISASATRVAAVGGLGDGVLLEDDGAGFVDVTPAHASQLIGVWLGESVEVACGVYGAIFQRESGAWTKVNHGLGVVESFHSVWVDDEGGIWAVGGQVLAEPLGAGLLAYRGTRTLPTTVSE